MLSRLVSHDLHQLADKNICISAGKRKSCSIEAVLRATPRFQNLANSNILLPSMVQVCFCMFNSALSTIHINDRCQVELFHLSLIHTYICTLFLSRWFMRIHRKCVKYTYSNNDSGSVGFAYGSHPFGCICSEKAG